MKKKLFIICLLTATNCYLFSQSNTWSVKFSDAIISRYKPTINTMTNKGWEYSNSIILHGMEKVYLQTHTAAYINYIKAYVDTYVNSSGTVSDLSTTLDKIHPGLLCLFLYEQTGQVKYKIAATNIRNYLLGTTSSPSQFGKTPDGGYWHKNNGSYNNVMMVDGIYMAHPFLVKYGKLFNDTTCFNVATFQTLLLASHVMPNSNLPKHAWDYSKQKTWANSVTGASSEVWSRGTGWFAMALVDILTYLPKTHKDYNAILSLFQRLATGIAATQDPVSGLWFQVVDKGSSSGNYLETTGSGFFIYALKKGVNNGWISSSYLPVIQKAWNGIQTKITTYSDGKPQINKFAPAMGVQNSYSGYVNIKPVNCPTSSGTQHPHGYAAILFAASAMEFSFTPLSALNNSGFALPPVEQTNEETNDKPLVYPVPFTNDLHIRFRVTEPTHIEIQLKTLSGNTLVKESAVYNNAGLYNYTMHTNIPKAVYLLYIIENNKSTHIQKVIKQ
jgi:unsaturated rhamnogalacturonyl hydrolase